MTIAFVNRNKMGRVNISVQNPMAEGVVVELREQHIDKYGIERDSLTLMETSSDGLVTFDSIKSTFEPGDL